MNFDLVRLALVSREQTSLFEKVAADSRRYSREEWLRLVLNEERIFIYRNIAYLYQPQGDEGKYITAKIGRSRIAVENASPEQSFGKIERSKWFASSLIFDPTHHEDGQKVAFEHNKDIGQSTAVLKALFTDWNLEIDSPFVVGANAITDPQTFWDFEKANRGNIVSASFELVAPNMFGIRDAIDKEMEEFRDNEKAVSATIVLRNYNGLDLHTDRVANTISYATEGGGSIEARTRSRRVYKSADKAKRIDMPELKEIEYDSFSSMIGRAISGIFGDD